MKLAQLLLEFEVPQLQEYVIPQNVLFRGLQHGTPNQPTFEEPIRTDRKPLDSSRSGTEVFNKLFEHFHGHANVRTRCTFCTTDFNDALQYTNRREAGHVVVVLPHKQSTIAYHPKSRDSIRIVANCEELWEDLMFMDADGAFDSEVAIDPFRMTGAQLLEFGRIAAEWGGDFSIKYKNVVEMISSYIVTNATELGRIDRVSELMIFDAPKVAFLNPAFIGIDSHSLQQMSMSDVIKHFSAQ